MTKPTLFGKGPDNVEETARVIEVEGAVARVQLEVNAACGDCASKGFCHPESGIRPVVEVANEVNASVGDIVVLEVSPGSRIGSSLIVFGLPILLLVIGAVLGMNLGTGSEDNAIVGAVAGLALGLLLIHYINRFLSRSPNIRPRAIRIIRNV